MNMFQRACDDYKLMTHMPLYILVNDDHYIVTTTEALRNYELSGSCW